jgi:hypothetical protein
MGSIIHQAFGLGASGSQAFGLQIGRRPPGPRAAPLRGSALG